MKNLLLFSSLLWALTATAQDKWDVANPPGNYTELEIEVNEGTWMNLDVSPDGKTIVFDLLGDIYSVPATGGDAVLLRGGLPFEVQPRFSPDGKRILFTSDAGGADNIWVMDTDGSNAKQITKEDFRLLNNACWAPNGEYIVARKHFTSGRSLGAGELWMYHISGGSGVQLTKRKNDQQDLNEPFFSPDGRYVYYSEDMYPGGYFQYNKDPNSQIYVVKKYDTQTGESETVISGPGGAVRPQPSPDGKYIAFVKRVRTKSVLYLHEIESGLEWPIYDSLSKDQQEAWAIFGVYTGYNWMPDSKNLVIWANGQILNINTATLETKEIPFKAKAKHRIREAVKHPQQTAPDTFDAKMIRHAVTSPDGKLLVFNAVGYLWKKELPNGKPVKLSRQEDHFEFEPSFSPNGKSLLYVSWSDVESGAVMEMNTGSGKSIKLTEKRGIYRKPAYSSDGKQIVFWKEKGNDHQGFAWSEDHGLYIMDKDGKNLQLISKEGMSPVFSADNSHIYYEKGNDYYSYSLEKKKSEKIISSKYGNNYVPSPDGKWIAFTDLHKIYVAAFPATGKTLELSGKSDVLPVAQFSKDAGISLHWTKNGKLHWTLGDQYFSSAPEERFLFMENAPDSLGKLSREGLDIGLQLPSDKPKQTIVLNNARIITANKTNEVIEHGYIVVKDNKILEMGSGSFDATARKYSADKVYDYSGKTIMPGLVDVHAHLWTFRLGLNPQQYWPYYANLAYGVTTTHDPSSNTEMVFSQSEMVKYGSMVGPRIFSTGTILYGAEGDFKAVVNNLEDAYSHVYRTKAFGAFSVKSYNQPRREQRQQIITAADSLGIMVYPEGGSFFYHNMSMILDGHTGIEHNIPVATLHDDVVKLWSASKSGYTPTLIVCYGAPSGENYWYQKTNVWEKERLMNFTPRMIVDARARHRTMVPDEEYENGHILVSQSCKKLSDAGVKVNLGSHGQLEGLGAHWELWMLAQGGMSPMEVIKSGTINGAEYVGMGDQIGSLEIGKLADLLVLDENPLDNIRNTEKISKVMINGRLYDAASMNEESGRQRSNFWFEKEKYSSKFNWNEESGSFTRPKCSCGRH